MIIDKIVYANTYQDEKIKQILQTLKTISSENFPKEKITIIENEIFINPVTLTSKDESDCIFEAHKRYIDIHYIVSGEEVIQVSDVRSLKEHTPYDETKDIMFLTGDYSSLSILKAGDFMICYPHDAHKVAIKNNTKGNIKKLVGKILV